MIFIFFAVLQSTGTMYTQNECPHADLDKKLNYDTQCLSEFLEDYQGSLNSIINGHQRYIKGIDMSNVDYRPVSNLPFLSKLVEKCVLIQFYNHLKIEYFECGTSKCLQGRSQL